MTHWHGLTRSPGSRRRLRRADRTILSDAVEPVSVEPNRLPSLFSLHRSTVPIPPLGRSTRRQRAHVVPLRSASLVRGRILTAGHRAEREKRPGGRDRRPRVGEEARPEGAVGPDRHRADDDRPGGIRVELRDGVPLRPEHRDEAVVPEGRRRRARRVVAVRPTPRVRRGQGRGVTPPRLVGRGAEVVRLPEGALGGRGSRTGPTPTTR